MAAQREISLEGVSVRKGDRHAFVYERVYEIIARDNQKIGTASYTKHDLAQALQCSPRSIDRAIRRLRREGVIESVPRYDSAGGQLANAYRVRG